MGGRCGCGYSGVQYAVRYRIAVRMSEINLISQIKVMGVLNLNPNLSAKFLLRLDRCFTIRMGVGRSKRDELTPAPALQMDICHSLDTEALH